MKIIDISREVFTAPNYDDDPQPKFKWFRKLGRDSEYNLSLFGMTPHTGTHIDAPLHYFENGESIDECSLERCYGACTVVSIDGILTGEDMDKLLPYCKKRLLIHGKGKASLELSAARVLNDNGIVLVGIDSVSISFREQEEEVHRELLSNGTLILENLNLDGVSDGNYILCALPLKLGGMEASPVRAVLFCN
ncbi:MAG: cyclase family protein [Clostridia bacterium]|nr:cyclase family protein [Clostridia bacterium]